MSALEKTTRCIEAACRFAADRQQRLPAGTWGSDRAELLTLTFDRRDDLDWNEQTTKGTSSADLGFLAACLAGFLMQDPRRDLILSKVDKFKSNELKSLDSGQLVTTHSKALQLQTRVSIHWHHYQNGGFPDCGSDPKACQVRQRMRGQSGTAAAIRTLLADVAALQLLDTRVDITDVVTLSCQIYDGHQELIQLRRLCKPGAEQKWTTDMLCIDSQLKAMAGHLERAPGGRFGEDMKRDWFRLIMPLRARVLYIRRKLRHSQYDPPAGIIRDYLVGVGWKESDVNALGEKVDASFNCSGSEAVFYTKILHDPTNRVRDVLIYEVFAFMMECDFKFKFTEKYLILPDQFGARWPWLQNTVVQTIPKIYRRPVIVVYGGYVRLYYSGKRTLWYECGSLQTAVALWCHVVQTECDSKLEDGTDVSSMISRLRL